jgi:hypothetical protein
LLLQLIQLAAERYMGWNKSFAFRGRERCGALRLVEGPFITYPISGQAGA